MTHHLEIRVIVVADEASYATQHVQQKRTEVRSQRCSQEGIRQSRHLVMRGVAETGPETVRQGCYGGIRRSGAVTKIHDHGETSNHGGNDCQRPDGTLWGKVPSLCA